MQYFYDKQIRRWLQQVIAVFSHFNVQIGVDTNGAPTYQRVPVRYGDMSRMVAAAIKDYNDNKANTVPMMTVSITGLKYDLDRRQNPTFVDKMHVRERKFDANLQEYKLTQANALTVERIMPTPHELTFNLDIWTSNTDQKLQLLEQILPLFNPDLELQSTDNFVDWTSLSLITLDDISWSSRTVPTGTEDQIDIATLSFKLPIWLSLPAKVKKLGVIQTIITSVYDAKGDMNEDIISTSNLLRNRMYVTPTGYNLLLLNGQASLVPVMGPVIKDPAGIDLEKNDATIDWAPLVGLYGELTNGITQLRLRKDNPDTLSETIGTVAYHPTDQNILLFSVDVDTITSNSLSPVNAIIDPQRSGPSAGLPAATTGQRYLILNPINKNQPQNGNGANAWKSTTNVDFYANANDIIEYTGTEWIVAWNSTMSSNLEYVSNLKTGVQYKWFNSQWQKSYEGLYPAGTWSLVI